MRGNAARRAKALPIPRCAQTGKLQFRSRAQARSFSRRRQNMPERAKQNEYVCPHCKMWHLTTAPEAR
jgi:hypothetical protein